MEQTPVEVQVYDGDGLFDDNYVIAERSTKLVIELKGLLMHLRKCAETGMRMMNNNCTLLSALDLKDIEKVIARSDAVYDWLNGKEPYEPAMVTIMNLGYLAAVCMVKGFKTQASQMTQIVAEIDKIYAQRRRC